MTTRFGILPYDTADDSVVFRSPMTSLASITDIGGLDRSTANNVFDSVKGMSPRINGSNVSGINFHLSTMTLESGSYDNLPQGQLSFEVERAYMSIPASVTDSESEGYENSTNEVCMAWGTNNGATGTLGYLYKRTAANNYDFYIKAGQSGQVGSVYSSDNSVNPAWSTVTVSWTVNKVDLYIDGLHIFTRTRSASNALTQFGDIYLGNYGNGAGQPNWNNQYYMRNFIMSSRPVVLNYHPILAHIMSVGDSFAGGQYQNITSTVGQVNEVNTIAGRLNEKGFGFNSLTVYSNGGGAVINTAADDLKTDINGAGKTRAQGAAEKPTFIIFQGGVNDSGIYTTPEFLDDLKEHVMEWMADGVTYTANVAAKRMILVLQVSSANTSDKGDLSSIHADILSIPAWWDAAYPSRAGHVQVVDPRPDLTSDGDSNIAAYQQADLVHPNSLGDYIYGQKIADKMLQMLG